MLRLHCGHLETISGSSGLGFIQRMSLSAFQMMNSIWHPSQKPFATGFAMTPSYHVFTKKGRLSVRNGPGLPNTGQTIFQISPAYLSYHTYHMANTRSVSVPVGIGYNDRE